MFRSLVVLSIGLFGVVTPALAQSKALATKYYGGKPWHIDQSMAEPGFPESLGVSVCKVEFTQINSKYMSVLAYGSFYPDINENKPETEWYGDQAIASKVKISDVTNSGGTFHKTYGNKDDFWSSYRELTISNISTAQQPKLWKVQVYYRSPADFFSTARTVTCEINLDTPQTPPLYDRSPGRAPRPL